MPCRRIRHSTYSNHNQHVEGQIHADVNLCKPLESENPTCPITVPPTQKENRVPRNCPKSVHLLSGLCQNIIMLHEANDIIPDHLYFLQFKIDTRVSNIKIQNDRHFLRVTDI